jgi:2-polyprenyl-3-methyl-5-hydroxy-6-metoxy-1,4-benzoquinol methylase
MFYAMSNESNIIKSWNTNAVSWINIIDSNGIESRRLVTNKAIVEAVCKYNPLWVLDIGCGEGWLAKELTDRNINVTGIDVVQALIDKAKQNSTGNFFVASYEDVFKKRITFSKLFDAVVINFALIGKESTDNLLGALPKLLTPSGHLIIQTLYPQSRMDINDYTTGWKTGSWDGLGEQFTEPYEWYFRTQEDWIKLLNESGFKLTEEINPTHPVTGKPCASIFICKKL